MQAVKSELCEPPSVDVELAGMKARPSIALAMTALLCSSCAADPNADPLDAFEPCEDPAYQSDFAWIQANVLSPTCATNESCHQSQTGLENLDLQEGNAYLALLAVSEQASELAIVEPGAPDSSYLMIKLGAYDSPFLQGELMPWQGQLCREQVRAIEEWILAGASP